MKNLIVGIVDSCSSGGSAGRSRAFGVDSLTSTSVQMLLIKWFDLYLRFLKGILTLELKKKAFYATTDVLE